MLFPLGDDIALEFDELLFVTLGKSLGDRCSPSNGKTRAFHKSIAPAFLNDVSVIPNFCVTDFALRQMTLVDTPIPPWRFSVIHAATSFSMSGKAARRKRSARLFRGMFLRRSRCDLHRRMQLSSIENCLPAARLPWLTAYAITHSLNAAVYEVLGEPLSDMIDSSLLIALLLSTCFTTSVGSGSSATIADWLKFDSGKR